MAWALWLAIPVGVTAATALVTWWRGRPVRPRSVEEAMRDHDAYLAALITAPRGRRRVG
jgi:hypothetical protein